MIILHKINKVKSSPQISDELLKRMDNDTELLTYMATFLSDMVTKVDKISNKLDSLSEKVESSTSEEIVEESDIATDTL